MQENRAPERPAALHPHYPGHGYAAQRFRDTSRAFSPTVDAEHQFPKSSATDREPHGAPVAKALIPFGVINPFLTLNDVTEG